jgi:uncharacterized membrane protein YqgA involved in biofilm formation
MGAVLAGGTVGLLLHKGFPEGIRQMIFNVMGLFTLVIGFMMAAKMREPVAVIVSIIVGGLIGELLRLEDRSVRAGDFLKAKIKAKDDKFTEGLVTAFMIFCVGSLTIVGAIDEGIRNDPTLLFTKSIMDGIIAVTLAASFGAGVLFSVIPMFIYQYGVTLLAVLFRGLFNDEMIAQTAGVGGVLILGVAVNLLELKKIRVINLLPALIIIALVTIVLRLIFPH